MTRRNGALKPSQTVKCPSAPAVIGLYLAGLSGTCFGVVILRESDMGLDAWNAVFVGLERLTPLTFGMWSILIQGSFWIIASLLNRKAELRCIFPIIWKGLMLDMARTVLQWIPFGTTLWVRIFLFAVGYLIVGISTGVYVATGYPKMPIDGLMVALSQFFSWNLIKARLLIEITGFLTMLLVGGPFGAGTILITFTIGALVSAARTLAQKNMKRWNLKTYGERERQ